MYIKRKHVVNNERKTTLLGGAKLRARDFANLVLRARPLCTAPVWPDQDTLACTGIAAVECGLYLHTLLVLDGLLNFQL